MLTAVAAVFAACWPLGTRAQPRPPAAGSYELNPATARLSARMGFLKFGQFTTRFRRLSGDFTYDPQRAGVSGLTIRVDPRSMDKQDTTSGRQMLAAFEPDRYPTITFVVPHLETDGSRQTLTGELTLHGVTRPVTLNVALGGMTGGDLTAFTGAGRIRRSDFGITSMRGVVADHVDLTFQVEFVRKQGR